MKTRKLTLLFCTLCLLFATFTLPAAAKSKSGAPKKLVLSRKEILLYVGETKELSVKKVKPKNSSAAVTWRSKKQKVASIPEASPSDYLLYYEI